MMSVVFSWLLALWAKASILMILALVADRVLRRAPAHTRHAMWTGTFVALLALPILSAVLPALPVPGLSSPSAALIEIPPGEVASPATEGPESGELSESPARSRIAHSLPASPGGLDATARTADADAAAAPGEMPGQTHGIPATPPNKLSSVSMAREYGGVFVDRLIASAPASVLGAWAAGALVALAMLLTSFRRASRLVARAGDLLDISWRTDLRRARALLGMRETVRLRASSQIGTPMAGGLLHRVVLVPDLARRWSAERRRFVLLHELVHLVRRDPARHLIARLALVLHWPNPLAWLAAHRAIATREEACDEQVLTLGAKPSSYARELLELNRLLQPPKTVRLAALPMIQRSQMEKRVMNILRDNRRPLRRPVAVALVAVACMATLSVAAAAPQEPEKVKVSVKVAPVVKVAPAVQIKIAHRVQVKAAPRVAVKVAPRVKVAPIVKIAPAVKLALAPEVVVSIAREVDVKVDSQVVATLTPAVVVSVGPEIVALAPMPMTSGFAAESACSVDGSGDFSGTMSMRSDDDDGYTVQERIGTQDGNLVFITRHNGKTLCMRSSGDVELNRETGQIGRIGSDGLVVWEAHDGNTVQRLEVRAGDDFVWSIDGDERAFDTEARAWYDGMREVVAGQWAIATLRGEVASKRGEMASIRGAAASVRGEMASARGAVASMRGEIASTRGEAASMRGKMASVRGEAASMRGRVASERGAIASLNSQRRRADDQERAAIDGLIKDHEATIEQMERDIEAFGMDARVQELERELQSMELDEQGAAIEARIDEYHLQGRLADLDRDMKALRLDENLERIEAEIEAMNASERLRELESRLEPAMERLQRLIESTR